MKTLMKNMPDIEGLLLYLCFSWIRFWWLWARKEEKDTQDADKIPGAQFTGGRVSTNLSHSEEVKGKEKTVPCRKWMDTGKVNYGRRPCYDTIDEIGSSVYLTSLPVFLVRVCSRIQNKMRRWRYSMSTAKHCCRIQAQTTSSFYWKDFGDWKLHPFLMWRRPEQNWREWIKWFTTNTRRGWIHKIPTHWDFIGWRKVAAKTCHGSYTSHYVEGMMLHVWSHETALLTTILTSIWG
jgi:hypothetical protein